MQDHKFLNAPSPISPKTREGQRRTERHLKKTSSLVRPLEVSISARRTSGVVQRTVNLSLLDPAFIAELRNRLPVQTAEAIQDTFGISANTWLKLCKGKPIRRSVAERLLDRFGANH